MKHTITFKGELDRDLLRKLVEQLTARVEKRARRFPPEAVHLHAVVEQHPRRPLTRVSLTLHVPSATLAARAENKDPEAAVREAFEEITRELEKEKARLRGEHAWKKAMNGLRQRILARLQPGREEEARITEGLAFLEPFLRRVESYVRREIRMRIDFGDLHRGEVDPRDVFDAVVCRALAEMRRKQPEGDVQKWLLGLAAAELRRIVGEERDKREHFVSIEEDIPEFPPEDQVSTMDSEIFEYYQPDEDLRMEDVLPALDVPNPEQAEIAGEFGCYLASALASLPTHWRDAFLLHDVEELSWEEVAAATGRSVEQVQADAERARHYLQEKARDFFRTGAA